MDYTNNLHKKRYLVCIKLVFRYHKNVINKNNDKKLTILQHRFILFYVNITS